MMKSVLPVNLGVNTVSPYNLLKGLPLHAADFGGLGDIAWHWAKTLPIYAALKHFNVSSLGVDTQTGWP